MITQAPSRSRLIGAIAFTLSCLMLAMLVWSQLHGTIPLAPIRYQVGALFKESGDLVAGADVRISGVNVGTVSNVQPRGVDSYAIIDIDRRYAPIPADTRAILRQKTLLGEAYVALSTGTGSGRKLPDGGTIPSSQVEQSQQLDQVLGSFNAQARRNISALVSGTALALAGRGQDLSNALGNLVPAVSGAAAVLDAVDGQRGAVGRLARDAGTILGAVGSRAASLQTLATAGNEVLSATASRDRQLTATVDALPAFLSQLRETLGALDNTFRIAAPSVLALQPAGTAFIPALSDLVTLSGPAIRLLHEAPSLLDAGTAALPALERFTSALRPAADAVLPAAEDLAPIIDYLASYGREITTTLANAAASTEATAPAATTAPVGNVPAGTAHYARVLPPLNDQMFFGQSVREPTNRHSAYIAPGGLAGLATGLTSSDCANLGDPAEVPLPGGLTNVPCVAASGWSFEGLTKYFPHVARAPAPK